MMRRAPAYTWPAGARMAVVFNVMFEGWSDGKAPGIGPMGNPIQKLQDTTSDRTSPRLPALPDLSLWTRVGIREGVELHIEGSRYRLSPARMLRLREAVREIIGGPFPPEPDIHEGDDDHGQD